MAKTRPRAASATLPMPSLCMAAPLAGGEEVELGAEVVGELEVELESETEEVEEVMDVEFAAAVLEIKVVVTGTAVVASVVVPGTGIMVSLVGAGAGAVVEVCFLVN